MLQTSFTRLFNIQHPVVQGGMQWVARAELVAAVAEAGGLGFLSALTQPTPEDLRLEIERTRALTSMPFGVNLTILPTLKPVPYDEYVKVIIESGIRIVETAGRSPREHMRGLKDAGVLILHKCTSVRHALSAERTGVDAISIDGFEAAGHTGEDDVPNMVLIPRLADSIKIPFIASGGFADGRGLVAALALGAGGINMGTRFMATVETQIHDQVKACIVASDELKTAMTLRSFRNTSRVHRNSIAEKVLEIERGEDPEFSDVREYVAGMRGRRVYETGDVEAGIWTTGLSQALVHDVPTVRALIERIVADATALIRTGLPAFISAD